MTFDYKSYREQRYLDGGNSGRGSYGENALFKAAFINNFIKEHDIKSALEIGCGDGNNLELYQVDKYVGIDVSKKAIDMCKEKFAGDETKEFHVFEGEAFRFPQEELTLCLDVTYHIFPREEWETTIMDTLLLATKYAIFYSFPNPSGHAVHINDYNFDEFIKAICQEAGFELIMPEDTPPDSQSRLYVIKK